MRNKQRMILTSELKSISNSMRLRMFFWLKTSLVDKKKSVDDLTEWFVVAFSLDDFQPVIVTLSDSDLWKSFFCFYTVVLSFLFLFLFLFFSFYWFCFCLFLFFLSFHFFFYWMKCIQKVIQKWIWRSSSLFLNWKIQIKGWKTQWTINNQMNDRRKRKKEKETKETKCFCITFCAWLSLFNHVISAVHCPFAKNDRVFCLKLHTIRLVLLVWIFLPVSFLSSSLIFSPFSLIGISFFFDFFEKVWENEESFLP